jgi:hypothetical protein
MTNGSQSRNEALLKLAHNMRDLAAEGVRPDEWMLREWEQEIYGVIVQTDAAVSTGRPANGSVPKGEVADVTGAVPAARPEIPRKAESDEEWYEREKAAFRAWWESEGEKAFSVTPTMAAGAGWLKRAESAAAAPLEMPTKAEMLLSCGEMTASEQRAAMAALKWFINRANEA